MNFLKIISILFLTTNITLAQDDLDDIFDDGDKDSRIFVGTNINTLATGTLNAYADFYPIERLRFSLGLGAMPFDNYRNYLLSILSDGEIPSKFTNLSGGNFLSLGFAVKSGLDNIIDFDYYYYGIFRNRNFGQINDLIKVRQRTFSVGIGYLVGLPGRFNLDIMAGLAIGSVKVSENIISETILSDSRGAGFELSFGLNYAL